LLPVLEESARVVDWFDTENPTKLRVDLINPDGEWHLLAMFNWENYPADLKVAPDDYQLPPGTYLLREFWTGGLGKMTAMTPHIFPGISPHGCVVVAARRIEPNKPQYIGSDLHISQGIELVEWHPDGNGIEFTLRLNRKTNGTVFLKLPGGLKSAKVNGNPATWHSQGDEIFSIDVEVEGFAQVKVA
jgi:alpha-galactosidase